jgi:hypothetical protein
MKNLITETNRIRKLMELPLITEQTSDKISILLDGTSSAGKSHTSELLNAVPYHEATDPNQWVIIGSDDFGGTDPQVIENRMKYDHAGDGQNKEAGEEFHKEMSIERKGAFGEKRGDTTVDFPKHPRNKDKKSDDGRNWYMAQEFKYGPWKKVIFDDIGNGILKYVPNVKHNILLHAPLYILLKNVSERNKMGEESQHRDPKMVLTQYLEKYEASKQIPDISKGDPTTELTYKGLVGLLSQSIDDKKYIKDFLSKLGIQDGGVYYIKIKDQYLTSNTQLINVDSDRKVYLDKFKDIVS